MGDEDIILRGFESRDLDYKAPMAWHEQDKKSCCGLVKDILGMANTLGGYLVIGASETPSGFSLDGVTVDQAATFETTRLNRFLQNYADPPINTTIRKATHDGKTFILIAVPRFTDTPHICQRDYPGVLSTSTLYVRTNNNETAPVRSSADFRVIIEQATRNRHDALLTAFRAILVRGGTAPTDEEFWNRQFDDAVARFQTINPLVRDGYLGYLEANFHPKRFHEDRFALEELRPAAEKASIDFRGWPFLFMSDSRPDCTYVIQDGLETLIGRRDFRDCDRLDFWQLRQSGFFYQRVLMWEESHQRSAERPAAADVDWVAIYCGEAVHCLVMLYGNLLEDTEDVVLQVRVLGTQGRILASFDRTRAPLNCAYKSMVPEIVCRRERTLAEWRAGLVDHAVEIARDIYLRFNWTMPNLGVAREMIERTFSRRQ